MKWFYSNSISMHCIVKMAKLMFHRKFFALLLIHFVIKVLKSKVQQSLYELLCVPLLSPFSCESCDNTVFLLNQAQAGHRLVCTWFLRIALSAHVSMCVCMCVFVYVCMYVYP